MIGFREYTGVYGRGIMDYDDLEDKVGERSFIHRVGGVDCDSDAVCSSMANSTRCRVSFEGQNTL